MIFKTRSGSIILLYCILYMGGPERQLLFNFIGKIILLSKPLRAGSQGLPRRSEGTAAEGKMLPGGSPPQAEYPAKPDTFLSYSKERPIR